MTANAPNHRSCMVDDSTTSIHDGRVVALTSLSGADTRNKDASSIVDVNQRKWRHYRLNVLALHKIRILDKCPLELIPETFLRFVRNRSSIDVKAKPHQATFHDLLFGRDMTNFVSSGLLPTIDYDSRFVRTILPEFNAETLPQCLPGQENHQSELANPRPNVGCGFSTAAFSDDDIDRMPTWMRTSGRNTEPGTEGHPLDISMYSTFLTFERTFGMLERRPEAASDRCAINGAHCLRALQLLYSSACRGRRITPMPLTFTCIIDDTIAILNYHWIGKNGYYYMSPLCKFDLAKAGHFDQLLIWIDAIGQWAAESLLPTIKSALSRLKPFNNHPNNLSEDTVCEIPSHNGMLSQCSKSVSEKGSPPPQAEDVMLIVSSVADKGSSVDHFDLAATANNTNTIVAVGEEKSANFYQSGTHLRRRTTIPPSQSQSVRAKIPHDVSISPQVDVAMSEYAWQRCFDRAMDEIADGQAELQAMKCNMNDSLSKLRMELSEFKNSLDTILQQEMTKTRSYEIPSRGNPPSGSTALPSSPLDFSSPDQRSFSLCSNLRQSMLEPSGTSQTQSPTSFPRASSATSSMSRQALKKDADTRPITPAPFTLWRTFGFYVSSTMIGWL